VPITGSILAKWQSLGSNNFGYPVAASYEFSYNPVNLDPTNFDGDVPTAAPS
jgi:hypothetical protein